MVQGTPVFADAPWLVLGILVAGRITVAKDGRKGKGEGMTTKHCTRCDRWKRVEAFAKNKNHADGLQTYCRECMKPLRAKNYRRKPKQHNDEWDGHWKSEVDVRTCLRIDESRPTGFCGRKFMSTWPGNRKCPKCERAEVRALEGVA